MKPQSYRQRLNRFAKSYVVMDLRDPSETRLARATAYERRYKTAGRPSWYKIGPQPASLNLRGIWIAESNPSLCEPNLRSLYERCLIERELVEQAAWTDCTWE